jgi:predicted transposase YdaD
VLLGLRFSAPIIESIRAGAFAMKESVTYQMIVEEGRQEGRQQGQLQGIHKTLFIQGKVRFGKATPSVEAQLQQIVDLGRLERMSEQLLQVNSWEELLATA